jgi:hypothetical protein
VKLTNFLKEETRDAWDKWVNSYECPSRKNKPEAEEIALTVSKMPEEKGPMEFATCVECATHNNKCNSEEHCAEDSEGSIGMRRRAYVQFYDSNYEDDEEFDDDESIPELEPRPNIWMEEEMITEDKRPT